MKTHCRCDVSTPVLLICARAAVHAASMACRAARGSFTPVLLGMSLSGLATISAPGASAGEPTKILFMGNSFTHGRFDEVRLYNAENVHDVNCPFEVTFDYPDPTDYDNLSCYPGAGPDSGPLGQWAGLSGTEQKPVPVPVPTLPLPADPTYSDPTETSVDDPLFYPTMLRYGPYGGIPGLFQKFTMQAGLDYEVAILAQGSATLQSFCRYSSSVGECTDRTPNTYLTKIANAFPDGPPDAVVLQEQSFKPLPVVNALGNPTRGTRTSSTISFVNSVNSLQRFIHGLNDSAKIFLYETHALANYVYTSDNPDKPIFGTSTFEYQSSIGTSEPIRWAPYLESDGGSLEMMTADLHDAYFGAAGQNPRIAGVAPAGDAWMRAIQEGIARRNPYIDEKKTEHQVSLWDEDPALACCTVPIGYHTSRFGAYLSALVLFARITGVNPMDLGPNETVAADLGIPKGVARRLQRVAYRSVHCQDAADAGLPGEGFCSRPATH